MITAEKLHALQIGPEWVEPLNATIQKFTIFTVKEQAAFIGQCAHECNHFKTLEENLNYEQKPFKSCSVINSSPEKLIFTPTIPLRLPTEFTPIEAVIETKLLEMGIASTDEAVSSLPFTIITGTAVKPWVRIL